MEALKAIKIIGNQNDGRAVFLCLPNTGSQRVLNFMRDPKLAHILVYQHDQNEILKIFPSVWSHFALKCFLKWLIGQLVILWRISQNFTMLTPV